MKNDAGDSRKNYHGNEKNLDRLLGSKSTVKNQSIFRFSVIKRGVAREKIFISNMNVENSFKIFEGMSKRMYLKMVSRLLL